MIIDYNPKYAQDFKALNIEWLETFFYVEDYDNEVLSNPDKYILDKGGKIFFSLHNNKVAGTVALMKVTDTVFELWLLPFSLKARILYAKEPIKYFPILST